jgi:hypothetical protein
MKPPKVCRHCDGALDLPHRSDDECFRALDHEIRLAQTYLRSLTRRKSRLLRFRIRQRQRMVAAARRRRA